MQLFKQFFSSLLNYKILENMDVITSPCWETAKQG